jgi:hypothetical protein
VNDSTLHVEPSPLPPKSSGALAHVWLVYAAHQRWGTLRTDYLPPRHYVAPNEVGGDSDRWRMVNDHLLLRAEWDVESERPGMLKRFVEFRDGKWDTDRYSPGLIPASLRTGGTNLVMQVHSWTNTEMGRLPVETVIASYRSDPNDLNGGLHLNATTRLKATHFDVLRTRRSFIPELTKATSVIDYRFSQGRGRPATYLSTNGVIHHTFEDAWAEAAR